MNTRTAVTLGLALLTHTFAVAADLLTNGSFESAVTGWTLAGGAPRYQQVATAYAGTNALRVFNRANFTNAPQQTITATLATATNGGTWTTRFAVQVAAPTTVRAWLRVVVDNAGVIATNRLLLGERVIRTTNQWERVSGTQVIAWTGALVDALFYVECGMKQEATGKAYPDSIFDDFAIRPDADGDGLWDEEEVPVAQGGFGTSPTNADTDGDGLPDGWEVSSGTNPLVADATADPDNDGFTNWQEFRTATSATNALSFPGRPTHAALTTNATAVLKYLAKLPFATTNRVLVGQHLTDTGPEWTNLVVRLQQQTGRWPGLVSFTAESSVTNTPVQTAGILPYALETWTNGGLVLIKWAPWNPWSGKFGAATVPTLIDIPELLNPSPALATNQVARSNYLAWRQAIGDSLTTLRDAGAPVLWRPFAEMNGTWFWWGNLQRDHYISLWRDLHGYFTQTRGLTNLLWVFEPDQTVHLVGGTTSSGTPIDYYYPGDDVVDVVGHNFYDDDWALPFRSDEIWSRSGKIFAVPQAGPSHLKRDGTFDNLTYLNGVTNTISRCAFFVPWNNITAGTNTNYLAVVDNVNASNLLAHPLVITRDEVNWQAELPADAPAITAHPQSQTVNAGASVTFTVVASGTAPLSHQWRKDGANLPGATGTSLALTSVQPADAGSYSVVVSNSAGFATSAAATLTVNVPVTPPVVTVQPQSQVVTAGTNVTLTVSATGTAPLSYQWQQNAVNLPGATAATLTLPNVTRAQTGSYVVQISNAGGATVSQPAIVRVLNSARLLPPSPLPGGGLRLSFQDHDGGPLTLADTANFEVWVSTNLKSTNWVRLPLPLTVDNGALTFDDSEAAAHAWRFYRVTER
ncbi:MAG: immunoglobulin domain-containing protein [Verrucomicrobia bacterium]|nr:immunoglobulin domain-containing protein [Verrucomicrobiota bacterium]